MMKGSCSDLTTLYTVLKHALMVSDVSEQQDDVITFYVAFCLNPNQIQMKFPKEYLNTVLCLQGLYITVNYLSFLGKKFRFYVLESGNISVHCLAIFFTLPVFNDFQ